MSKPNQTKNLKYLARKPWHLGMSDEGFSLAEKVSVMCLLTPTQKSNQIWEQFKASKKKKKSQSWTHLCCDFPRSAGICLEPTHKEDVCSLFLWHSMRPSFILRRNPLPNLFLDFFSFQCFQLLQPALKLSPVHPLSIHENVPPPPSQCGWLPSHAEATTDNMDGWSEPVKAQKVHSNFSCQLCL